MTPEDPTINLRLSARPEKRLAQQAPRGLQGVHMPSYEELQRRHVAEAMALLPDQVERLSWSEEQLAGHRRQALRRLVRTAQQRSPWHRRRLAGIDADVLGEEGLAALPVMSKEDLMGNFDEILTDPNLNLNLIETHIEGLTDDA